MSGDGRRVSRLAQLERGCNPAYLASSDVKLDDCSEAASIKMPGDPSRSSDRLDDAWSSRKEACSK